MKHDESGAYGVPGTHKPERVRARVVEMNGQEAWTSNPFWEAHEIQTRTKRAKLSTEQQMLVNIRTGQTENVAEISKVYEVDSDVFVKVFTRYLNVFFDLSKNAQRLFEVVLYEVGKKPNEDMIYLHPKTADRYHQQVRGGGYSKSSFYRAMDELIEKGILARAADGPHLFWINGRVFWNGDRVRFITELRRGPEILPPEKRQ